MTEHVSASELDFTERSTFAEDGRLFVVGVRKDEGNDAGVWLVEVVATGDGKHTTKIWWLAHSKIGTRGTA